MIDILEYILLPKATRQQHLRMDEACIERGGPQNGGLSSYCKGLMAHILDTSIPSGMKIHICHACNNGKCSNPVHLYWGTAQENRLDSVAAGNKSVYHNMIEKYGVEGVREINTVNMIGNDHGKGNAGKTKSLEHRQKIADSVTLRWKQKKAPLAELVNAPDLGSGIARFESSSLSWGTNK